LNNPILNSPYFEPTRHYNSDDRGVSDEILEYRRPSNFYIPVPRAKDSTKQLELSLAEGAYGSELQQENVFINKIREKISVWRKAGYPGVTKTTRDLLFYWQDETRENKLFFCQIEALETLIFITEVAEKQGESWVLNELKKVNQEANPGLLRMALKMATGAGKTVVMAMIIAYNTLNKLRYPQDTRFTDTFIVITPGITIRDRLNVLIPNDPQNYYRKRDIVSWSDFEEVKRAVVIVTNYHQLELRNNPKYQLGKVIKEAGLVNEDAFKETPQAMLNRVFKSILGKPRVMVINDEAHHCYREKQNEEKLSGQDRKEADDNNEAARVWISGIEYLAKKINVNAVVDLSATPYFLRGSGYKEGTLFPWAISDFSLLDALECGIVKIPRLPIKADNVTKEDEPEFKNLWIHVKDDLPKKGLRTAKGQYDLSSPNLPKKLQEALESLYGSYENYYKVYEERKKVEKDAMPPVMIVVCNNTTVSELVYRWIAGFQFEAKGKIKTIKGHLDIFRNEDGVSMLDKPNTLIIDSVQIEKEDKIDANFKEIFKDEIAEFHKEYRHRFPGRDEPADGQLLREVMNTVGKPGKLGENIKCVVSVSMLTEGWDVNTVTHVLGIRAFSTQLLCEQVVGRALRRVDYNVKDDGMMVAEYAEVYGVPFNFLKAEGGTTTPQPPRVIHRVYSVPEREKYEIFFPRLEGYRYEMDEEKLGAKFTPESKTVIENEPTEVVLSGVIGETYTEKLNKIRDRREGTVAMMLMEEVLNRYFSDGEGSTKYWLGPQIKKVVDEYVKTQVVLKDKMVVGYLSVGEYFTGAVTKIWQAISAKGIEDTKSKKIVPILVPYDSVGSTRHVDFLTSKEVRDTVKSHINYVVADTEEWEQGVAKKLEEMPEVLAYVKNHNLGFTIPYEHNGMTHRYHPDFVAKIEMKDKSILNLLIEVTGKKDDKKATKVKTAKELWVPAINNTKKHGKWAFLEVQDIHETQNLIRFGMDKGFDKIGV